MFGGNFIKIRNFKTNQVDVTDASAVAVRDVNDIEKFMYVTIKNLGANDVYIGSEDTVTSSNGFVLKVDESIDLFLTQGNQVYAITASGETAKLAVMEIELELA